MNSNDKQVGGKHYATRHAKQHWDFVWEQGLDYFQGQITRYVVRWKRKNGVEDLRKAQHYLEKYLELLLADGPPTQSSPISDEAYADLMQRCLFDSDEHPTAAYVGPAEEKPRGEDELSQLRARLAEAHAHMQQLEEELDEARSKLWRLRNSPLGCAAQQNGS